jgi:hypothetical protein
MRGRTTSRLSTEEVKDGEFGSEREEEEEGRTDEEENTETETVETSSDETDTEAVGEERERRSSCRGIGRTSPGSSRRTSQRDASGYRKRGQT